MNFFDKITAIALKLILLDKRTKEARKLKKELSNLWANATDEDLVDWALKRSLVERNVELFDDYLKRAQEVRFFHQAKREMRALTKGKNKDGS